MKITNREEKFIGLDHLLKFVFYNKKILTRTRLSVLSPFVSSFTIYLMRILVCRHNSALMLSVDGVANAGGRTQI